MEARRRTWIRATMWIGLAGAAMLFWFSTEQRVRLVPPDEAPAAPPLVLRGLDGAPVALQQLRGTVVVINLWAGWCAPCRAEIPGLSRLERDFGERGATVLGINVESRPAAEIAQLARQLDVGYRVVVPAEPLTGLFAGEGVLPQTWIVDREGRLRASHAGLASERSLRGAIERLLDEEPAG